VNHTRRDATMNPRMTAWPRRRHYLLLALCFSGIAVYGSLLPFHFAPLGFGEAVRQLREILSGAVGRISRSDCAVNVLLFVPIGYCLLAVLTIDRRKRAFTMLCLPLAALTCAALSVGVEFGQLWLPDRVPSLSDIVAQIIGAAVGMGLWLTAGQNIADWVRSYTVHARPKGQVDWLLEAYLIGLLIYSVMPLDLITRPGELVHKYRAGRIVLTPFANAGWEFTTFYGLLRDVAVFVPVGMFAATWMTPPERPVRRMGMSVLLGALIALTIETAQLFVYSGFTTTGDLICGTIGACLGAWTMRLWRGGSRACRSAPPLSKAARRTWLWLGLAAVYAVFLAAVFCAPFETIDDLQRIRARYHGFLRFPFAAFSHATKLELVSDVLEKLLFFAPLGGLLTLAVARLPVPRPIRRILLCIALLAASGAATAIEIAQVFLPPHVPSSTDVVLCTVGAAIGMLVTLLADPKKTNDLRHFGGHR